MTARQRGSIVIWPSKNQVLETIPEPFKPTYSSTNALKTPTAVSPEDISNMPDKKNYLE